MSELLKLREWLGLADAVRYARHLGLDSNENDFFCTYADFDYPLKLAIKLDKTYLYKSEGTLDSYPLSVTKATDFYLYDWSNSNFKKCNVSLQLSGAVHQHGYAPNAFVFSDDSLDNVDEILKNNESVVGRSPVYWSHYDEGKINFLHSMRMLSWGELLNAENYNELLLSRVHIEEIVSLALGKPEPQQTPPEIVQNLALPPYCDTSHESYAPELHTALMLWEALYIKNERNTHDQHTGAVTNWLAKNKAALPIAMLAKPEATALKERLISITNPLSKKPKK